MTIRGIMEGWNNGKMEEWSNGRMVDEIPHDLSSFSMFGNIMEILVTINPFCLSGGFLWRDVVRSVHGQ